MELGYALENLSKLNNIMLYQIFAIKIKYLILDKIFSQKYIKIKKIIRIFIFKFIINRK